jgi:hypothetical protein
MWGGAAEATGYVAVPLIIVGSGTTVMMVNALYGDTPRVQAGTAPLLERRESHIVTAGSGRRSIASANADR